LSVSELLQLNDTALRRNPILNRLREIVNQNKEGNYQFKDPAIIGNADLFDTAFISFWINRSQNMESKTSFAYRWVTESDNKNEAFLIALEKQAPVFRYSQLDLDSVVLEPFYGILEQISKFTGEKPDPSSYTLKMVFKLESITSLKKWITADTTHPYIAIISSGPFKYCFTIRRTALLKNNCFRSVTSIDPKKLRDFKDKFGGPIFEMPH
jgi:hypothetical protein